MNGKFVLKQYAKMAAQSLFLPLVYRLCKRKKVQNKRVIFADAHHASVPFSMRFLLEEAQKTDREVVTLFSDYARDSFFTNLRNMVRFMRLYANAGCVVICDNFLPAAACKKRAETTVIQLWHACGSLKKFGYDAKDDIPAYYHGNVERNCDYVTVSAPACVPHFARAMGLPEARVVPLGISRTDLYFQETFLQTAKARFFARYPAAKGKRVILWAPTFRGNAAHPTLCGEEAIDALAKQLGESYVVVRAVHPHMRPKDAACGREKAARQGHQEQESLPSKDVACVREKAARQGHQGQGSLSKDAARGCGETRMETEEMLVAADLLVTDYSSVLFDALLLGKPIVRFAPDLAEYARTRGFYVDYCALPGPLATNARELCQAVAQALAKENGDAWADARERAIGEYLRACDGHATERILRLIP